MGYIYGKPARDRHGAWWYWGKHPAGSKTPEIVDGFPSKEAAQEHAERHGYGRSPRPEDAANDGVRHGRR